MLADARSPALLTVIPPALVLADARCLAFLAYAPYAMRADARSPALLASVPFGLILADARSPDHPHSMYSLLRRWCSQVLAPQHSLHLLLSRWCSQMLDPLHSLHVLLWRWWAHKVAIRLSLLARGSLLPHCSFTNMRLMIGDSRSLARNKPPGHVGSDGFNFCRLLCTGLPQLLTSWALV